MSTAVDSKLDTGRRVIECISLLLLRDQFTTTKSKFAIYQQAVRMGPWVIRPFNFLLKLKIENRCQYLIFITVYHKKQNNAKSTTFYFFHFSRKPKQKIHFYLYPVNNEEKM